MGSTTKAKYFVAHLVTNEITRMGKLLGNLGYGQVTPIELWINNQVAIQLVQNLEFHQHTKHIDIKYHIIREKYENSEITMAYISMANLLIS
jgi:hypothetical protein